jgi:hypothetical protein
MAFLSCKLYKIEGSRAADAVKLFGKKASPRYDTQYGQDLHFIVRPIIAKNDFGLLTNVFYDRIITVRTIDPDTMEATGAKVRQTEGPVTLFLYTKAPLEFVLGVFANFASAEKIGGIVNVLLAEKAEEPSHNVHEVQFLLDQKEKEIRGISGFSNVSEISVEDINDMYVDAVWMKGSRLDLAPEYRKYVTDEQSGGRIKFLTLAYKERAYYLLSDGRIFTKQGKDPGEDYPTIYELVSKLNDVKAVRF